MADIVERLREFPEKVIVPSEAASLMWDAADRIEQLHMELIKAGELIDADLLARAVKAEHNWATAERDMDGLAAEIERLRKELSECRVVRDSALDVSEQARHAALEEAAKVADPIGGDTGETDYEKQAYDLRWNIAAAIRALKDNHARR